MFKFPAEHCHQIRTINGLDRVNQGIPLRTKAVGIIPNEMACLRLTSAIMMEKAN